MLTEQQLKAIPTEIWHHFRKLELAIIARICWRIGEVGRLSRTDVLALDDLQRIGFDMVAIQREVAATLNVSARKIYDVFEQAAEMEYNGMRAGFELTGRHFVPFAENERVRHLVEAYSRATVADMRNLAHTIGFVNANNHVGVRVSHGTFQPLEDFYQDVIDFAALQVRTGQRDFYSAMRATIRQMSDLGLSRVEAWPVVNYESGYRRRLDTAVRANIMDSQARLSLEMAQVVGEQFGADGMEVRWHSGARPSHVWIGGIQVGMALFEAEVRPVMDEPNCYHRAFPILLGISPPTHSADELRALNAMDAEEREYKGEQYNAYKAQQKQREYETEIRKYKDRANAYKAVGDMNQATECSARVRALQAEYKRFSDATGRDYHLDRARVPGYRNLGATVEKRPLIGYNKDGTVIVTDDWTTMAHPHVPTTYKPDAVIDTLSGKERQRDRTFYDLNGDMRKQINSGPHGNAARHPYGEHGEHGHDIFINDNGKRVRTTRELTEEERKENADIL